MSNLPNQETTGNDPSKMAQISLNTGFVRELVRRMLLVNADDIDKAYTETFNPEDLKQLLLNCDIAEDLHQAMIDDIGVENF